MYVIQVLTLVVINGLLGLGAYLPLAGGRIVVCSGAFAGVGAIAATVAHERYDLPYAVALLLGMCSAGVFAGLVGILTARLQGFAFALATLGVGELARVGVVNSPALGGALGFPSFRAGPPLEAAILVGLCLALVVRFELSSRRAVVAVLRTNERLAEGLGINVAAERLRLIVASGVLSGLAGGLHIGAVGLLAPATFGYERSIESLLFPIAGGTGSFLGPVIGAFLLTVAPEWLRFSLAFRQVLFGALMIAVMGLRPQGLLPTSVVRLPRQVANLLAGRGSERDRYGRRGDR